MNLPPAVPKPCNDCPWRRTAAPGWLGPMSADDWTRLAHSDLPVACHQTLPDGGLEHVEEEIAWRTSGVRQCTGMAIFRKNIAKSPRNPMDAAHGFKPDREMVFAGDKEFIQYHTESGAIHGS